MHLSAWFKSLFSRPRPGNGDTGGEGERIAADWLKKEKGFRIVAQNWRVESDRRYELDIVARDGKALVFVEVKSRPASALVPGYYAAVKPRKLKAVRRAAKAYIRAMHMKPRTVRFDVVEVIHENDQSSHRVLHFENVPLFSKEYRRGH